MVKRSYRCWAEVDLGALQENLGWLRHRVGQPVKIMTVVKADAYGHGLRHIATLLMQSGTDIFGVANLAEARVIRSVGQGWPILILGACLPEEAELAVRDEIMPTLSSLAEAQLFSSLAVRQQKVVRVHFKIDTGMGRLGLSPSEAVAVIRQARQLPGLECYGLYTHFASAEDYPERARAQRELFSRIQETLAGEGIVFELLHANNSAALLYEPDSMFNLVRPGLLVYGVIPSGSRTLLQGPLPVRPALSFKCRVSFIKEIAAGTTLSYGHTFTAPRPMRVATLTAGYGDGYPRAGSSRARVLIGGRRCRVLGRVTMDQMIVDVSRVPDLEVGAEVVLIGRQGREEITTGELARWCRTIPWEVLTGISYRVPRVYLGGHAA